MEVEYYQEEPGSSQGPANSASEVDEVVASSSVPADTKNKLKVRYMMQFLVFYGMFVIYAMRTNLNITIISMVNSSTTHTNYSDQPRESTHVQDEKYNWAEDTQAWILNASFWGYITTQILGGYLAENFSVKWVFGYGIFFTSVLTILSQAAVKIHYIAFILLRVLEGVFEGVTFPSLYALCARWAPGSERTWMVGIGNLGTIVGTVVTIPVSAYLCNSSWGWPSVFYVFGSLGIVWSGLWYLLATSTPEKCRLMTGEEIDYIVRTRGVINFNERETQRVPWRKLLTSQAVWVISICKFTNSFIFYIFLTEMPNYLHYVFNFSIENNGWVNSAAYLSNAVVSLISSWSADIFIARNPAKITRVRKWYECSAQFLGAVTIGIIPLLGKNYVAVVAVLILNSAVNGLTAGGDVAVPIDIGPSQAGAIQGFANTVSNMSGIISPLLVGYLTKGNETFAAWNTVFLITAAISLSGSIIFFIWGSADIEEWAKEDEVDQGRLINNE